MKTYEEEQRVLQYLSHVYQNIRQREHGQTDERECVFVQCIDQVLSECSAETRRILCGCFRNHNC